MKRIVSVMDAMEKKVLTASPTTTVATAAKKMASRGVGSIVIVKGKKPVGILTERDLLMKVLAMDLVPSKVQVGKIMSTPVITISPKADITEAARLMSKNGIRRLPVVEGEKLVGIITASDIATISPELLEVEAHHEVPAQEEIEESVCEACGEVTTSLYEVNGMWVCENCRDAMGG